MVHCNRLYISCIAYNTLQGYVIVKPCLIFDSSLIFASKNIVFDWFQNLSHFLKRPCVFSGYFQNFFLAISLHGLKTNFSTCFKCCQQNNTRKLRNLNGQRDLTAQQQYVYLRFTLIQHNRFKRGETRAAGAASFLKK